MGNRKPRNVERSVQVYVDDLLPCISIKLIDRCRRTRDACVVYKYIKATKGSHCRGHHRLDVAATGNVTPLYMKRGQFARQFGQCARVDVTGRYSSACHGKGPYDFTADTRRTSSHKHFLIHIL